MLETQNGYIFCLSSHSNIEYTNINYDILHKILGSQVNTTTLLTGDYIGNPLTTKKTDIDPLKIVN